MSLKEDFKSALEDILPGAIENGMLQTFLIRNDDAKEICKNVAETITDLVADPLADRFAGAIDAYVKCMDITGTIITAGSPVTQTAVILTTTVPTTNGLVPNTLGVK